MNLVTVIYTKNHFALEAAAAPLRLRLRTAPAAWLRNPMTWKMTRNS